MVGTGGKWKMVEGLGSIGADDMAKCRGPGESPDSCRCPIEGKIGPRCMLPDSKASSSRFTNGLGGKGTPMVVGSCKLGCPFEFDSSEMVLAELFMKNPT